MRILIIIVTCYIFCIPRFLLAAISFDENGRWSTTFDCDDWAHPDSGACDGLTLTGGGPSSGMVNKTQIISSANHSSGVGGKGIRYWVKRGDKVLSAPVYANLPAPETELWIRYYTRWESGFEWEGGLPAFEKSWYIRTYPSGDPSAIPGMSGNNWTVTNQGGIQTGGGRYLVARDKGWSYIYSGGISDGSWYCVEVYLKMQSAIGVSDGKARVWINGDLVGEHNEVDWVSSNTDALQGWIQLMFRSNQSFVKHAAEMYVDYDDIEIYNRTPPNLDSHGNPFVGPIGWHGDGPGVLDLAIPTGLRIMPAK